MASTTRHSTDTQTEPGHHRLGEVLRAFPWVHLGIGLLGNTLFVVGSVMFFWEATKLLAIWIFVFASLGMFTGSLGELFVRIEKHRDGDD